MTASHNDKDDIITLECLRADATLGDSPEGKSDGKIQVDEQGFQEAVDALPKGYFFSPAFIGSFLAIGLGFWAGNSGLAYTGPILPIINADLGPDANVQWVSLVHPVGLSTGMTIVGRLGDLFGRRWFFIGGAFIALIGTLVSALAVNMNMLIVGAMIKAIAASTQLSVYYALVSISVRSGHAVLTEVFIGRTITRQVPICYDRRHEPLADSWIHHGTRSGQLNHQDVWLLAKRLLPSDSCERCVDATVLFFLSPTDVSRETWLATK